jgi:hypothetical protein
MTTNISTKRLPSGPAAAAFLSSAIGVFVIGLMTTGSVIISGLGDLLNWYNPSGPLSGKTGVAILVWLVSWVVLHSMWKDKEVALQRIVTWTLTLIVLGLALTFPPIFEAFE